MFDKVRNSRVIVQGILLIIVLSFALFGIGDYLRNASKVVDVATIGGQKITQQELMVETQRYGERLRSELGDNFKPELLRTPIIRTQVLNALIDQRLIGVKLQKSNMRIPQQWIQEAIAGIPAFQKDGAFSPEAYQAALQSKGLSESEFVRQIENVLQQQLMLAPIMQSAVVPRSSLLQWLTLQDETREVSAVHFQAQNFNSQVKLAADAAQKYYAAHPHEFEEAERVKVEYVVFDKSSLLADIKVSDEEAQQRYDQDKGSYGQPEERRASHILIGVAPDAKKEIRDAAHAKAEALLTKLKAKPNEFAELAKKESTDTLSAQQGGDLGFFGKKVMDPAFEQAVFSLKKGELSGIVATEYGFHIIKLTDIHEAGVRNFAEVKTQIIDRMKAERAAKKFSENAETFSDLVFSDPQSLKPVADKFGLQVKTSDWITRDGQIQSPLNNPKLLNALFSADAIQKHQNTEAVDVGGDTFVSARVIEHKPKLVRPLESVKSEIETKLKVQEAAVLAQKHGAEVLQQLQSGKASKLSWDKAQTVKRTDSALNETAAHAVFKAQTDKLPAYVGVEAGDSYTIYKITKAQTPQIKDDDQRLSDLQKSYMQLLGQEDLKAYLQGLRKRIGVAVNKIALAEAREPQ